MVLLASVALGGTCSSGGANKPGLSLTLNNVPSTLNEIHIVPASGFVINVTFSETAAPIDPASFELYQQRWGDASIHQIDFLLSVDSSGAIGVLPSANALSDGTHTLLAYVRDTAGRSNSATFNFAVRDFSGSLPIGFNQVLFFDFDVDRDGDLAPDFPVDLESFGLGSAVAPTLSEAVAHDVRLTALQRAREAYQSPSSGLALDSVVLAVTDYDPGIPSILDTTRICVGGADPSGVGIIGNIQIDANNGNRSSVECASLPLPTGVFPRELTVFSGQASYQNVFDPLVASRGGTPVGEHPLDATVLAMFFDYGSATSEEQDRFDDIESAIQAFGDALGSIMAHEAGHALGLVPPASPGVGLFGGQAGPEFSHAVEPDGSDPTPNYLMKAGNTFTFARLAGLGSESLPTFRALNWAYLRDRTRTDNSITQLLAPPAIDEVQPAVINTSAAQITVTGSGFAGIPVMQLVNPSYTYSIVGEANVDPETSTAWIIKSQVVPGVYDLTYANEDGQTFVLADSVTVE